MLNNLFYLNSLGTTVRREILAGITTFLTMAYIIVVNPLILGDAGFPMDGVLFATVLVAGISSIIMGLYAKLPIALAPGMGLNAFVAYTLVLGMGLSWQTALAAVFFSGIIFILLSLPRMNVREAIINAVPSAVRTGVAAGIGLFLSLIGLINAGIVVTSPATVVANDSFSGSFVLFIIGLIVAAFLLIRKVPGALVLSIIVTSAAALLFQQFGWVLNTVCVPDSIFAAPSLSAFFQLDIVGFFTAGIIAPVFALVFTDMFDSISTFMGVTKAANLVDENGNPFSPSWTTLNARVAYNITEYLRLQAGIENMFDLQYRPYSSGIVAPGRNMQLSLRALF